MRRIFSLLGFGLSTVLLGVAGLAFVPAVIHAAGPSAWGSVAFGQSLGILGSVLVGYGWAVTGPVSVARMPARSAVVEYAVSAAARLLIAIPTCAIGAIAIHILGPPQPDPATLAFLSTTLAGGFSASWYFIGRNAPYLFFFAETIPRVAGVLAAIAVLLGGGGLTLALTLSLAGGLVGFLVASGVILSRVRPLTVGGGTGASRRIASALGRQRSGLATGLGQTLFLSLPVVIVGSFVPSALPTFALVDKLLKQIISGIAPFISVAQGWVPRASTQADLTRRAKATLRAATLGALAVALFMLVGGRLVFRLLSAGQQVVSLPILFLSGALFGAIFLERMVGRVCLVSIGGERQLALATTMGSTLGLILIWPLTNLFGPAGAVAGVLTGILGVLVVEGLSWRRIARTNVISIPSSLRSAENRW